MANASLTYEKAHRLLSYDPETGVFRWREHMTPRVRAGSVAGTLGPKGYRCIRVHRQSYRAHRVAWLMTYGKWPDHEIDHLNGDRADNRIANLRDVPGDINQQNRRTASVKNRSTGVQGVRKAPSGKFQARLWWNGKVRNFGSFGTAEEAHNAYVAAKRGLHPGCTL